MQIAVAAKTRQQQKASSHTDQVGPIDMVWLPGHPASFIRPRDSFSTSILSVN